MKPINWDREKDKILIAERGVGFKEAVKAIMSGGLLDIINSPKKDYLHQKMFIVKINNYVYAIPFVENDDEIFLKTVYPDRKLKNKYLGK